MWSADDCFEYLTYRFYSLLNHKTVDVSGHYIKFVSGGGHLHQLQFLLSIPLMLFHFIFDQKKCELKSANLFLFYFIAILRMSMSDR